MTPVKFVLLCLSALSCCSSNCRAVYCSDHIENLPNNFFECSHVRKIHKKWRKLHIYFPGENIAAVLCYLKFNVRSGTTVRIQLQKWNTHLYIFTQRQNNGSSSLDLHPVPYQRVDMVFSDDFIIKMRGGRQMDFFITLTTHRVPKVRPTMEPSPKAPTTGTPASNRTTLAASTDIPYVEPL